MKTTLNCEIYFDRTLVIFVRSAVAAGDLEPSSQNHDFLEFSAFRDSRVYACAGSYFVKYI